MGGEVTYLSPNEDGLINLADLEGAITDKTILITVMYGNNEIGVVQDIKAISAIAKKNGISLSYRCYTSCRENTCRCK